MRLLFFAFCGTVQIGCEVEAECCNVKRNETDRRASRVSDRATTTIIAGLIRDPKRSRIKCGMRPQRYEQHKKNKAMKHFKISEFDCRCGCQMPASVRSNIAALTDNALDPAREAFGGPVYVTSGYRCAKHNAEVNGVKNSQHIKGEAADLNAGTPYKNLRLAQIIAQQGNFDQMILYVDSAASLATRFIHVSYKASGQNRHKILSKVIGQNGYTEISINQINQALCIP